MSSAANGTSLWAGCDPAMQPSSSAAPANAPRMRVPRVDIFIRYRFPRRPRVFYVFEGGSTMCRNIKTLFNFEPPATEDEIKASSLQFVRKLSGFTHPSKTNQAAFNRAVEDVAAAARLLIDSLVTAADPRDREIEAARAKAKSAARFG